MNKFCYLVTFLSILSLSVEAQTECNKTTEKLIGEKGSTYTVPCKDMVILDLKTYTKYRYMEKQYKTLDSLVSGYHAHIDSLDQENETNKAMLSEKIKNKEKIIEDYKAHSKEITHVLEKCKNDSKGFVEVYQQKVNENITLSNKVRNLRKQRNTFLGISAGLAGLLIVGLLR